MVPPNVNLGATYALLGAVQVTFAIVTGALSVRPTLLPVRNGDAIIIASIDTFSGTADLRTRASFGITAGVAVAIIVHGATLAVVQLRIPEIW